MGDFQRRYKASLSVLEIRYTIRRFAPARVNVAEEVNYIFNAEIADVVGIVPVAGIETLIARLERHDWAVVTSAQRFLAEVRLLSANLPIPDVLITAEDVRKANRPRGLSEGN